MLADQFGKSKMVSFVKIVNGFQPLTIAAKVSILIKKQTPKVFSVKRCSWKFPKFSRKTPVPEPLF